MSKFNVSSSPHIRSGITTQIIMRDVVIALLPACIYGVYHFGLPALTTLFLATVSAVATEYIIQKIRKVDITVNDYSAVVTGLLLGMNLPSTVPFWIPILGSVFAIAIAKQAFGGIGQNFINPALAARAFLMASWPVEMTSFLSVTESGVDAVTGPTTLAVLRHGGDLPALFDLAIGRVGGTIGETSLIFLLLGGIYLIYREVISVRIPAYMLGTVAISSLVLNNFNFTVMVYHLFAGGLILGAFFMATDYASSPITPKGQIIYAVLIGFITVIIRMFGGYNEGVSYAILLMNVAAPIINKYTSPTIYGGKKGVKK